MTDNDNGGGFPPPTSPEADIDDLIARLAAAAERLSREERAALATRVERALRPPRAKRGRRQRIKNFGEWRRDDLASFLVRFLAENPDANPNQIVEAFPAAEAVSREGLYARVTAIWEAAQGQAAAVRQMRAIDQEVEEAIASDFPTFDDEPMSQFLARWHAYKRS